MLEINGHSVELCASEELLCFCSRDSAAAAAAAFLLFAESHFKASEWVEEKSLKVTQCCESSVNFPILTPG